MEQKDKLIFNLDTGLRKRIIRNTFLSMLLIEINLVLLDFVFNFSKLIDYRPIRTLFNMQLENSLANWVSSLVYLSVGIVMWMILIKNLSYKAGWFRKSAWFFLAAFFTYLAMDDGAEIHERLGTTLDLYYQEHKWEPGNALLRYAVSFPSYYWQVIFAPIFVAISLGMFVFFYREFNSKKLFAGFLLTIAVLAFSQGLDFLEGIRYEYPLIQDLLGFTFKTVRHYSKVFEEFLEMLGMTIFTTTLLAHFLSDVKEVEVKFKS